MIRKSELPSYAPELEAYHCAHAAELRRMINDLPLSAGQRVLDMACGDGAYSGWLAERVGPTGIVVAADMEVAFLHVARRNRSSSAFQPLAARLEALPFPDAVFDMVWCAQSLVSLPRPVTALKQMSRVVRPGGYVAVMENDSLHQVLLPWSEELEIAVRQAELKAHQAQSDRPDKRYIGRRLRQVFQSAGLAAIHRKTYSTDRYAPLSREEHQFLSRHLKRLGEIVRPYLGRADRREFDRLTNPDSSDYLGRKEHFEMTCLDVVCWGQKRAPSRFRREGRLDTGKVGTRFAAPL